MQTAVSMQVHKEITDRYSLLTQLFRVVAWCVCPLAGLCRRKSRLPPLLSYLTSYELEQARIALVWMVQYCAFKKKRLSYLKNTNSYQKNINSILCILLYTHEMEYCTHSDLNHNPLILSHDSTYSRLLVRVMHQASLHAGPSHNEPQWHGYQAGDYQ